MDCNEDTEREIAKRTIALFFSLAATAESVAARSYFVRCYMLWILRRAEASAFRFVFGPQAMPAQQWFSLHRNSPADALHLAATLRDLARRLEEELRQDEIFSSWWNRRDKAETPALDHPFGLIPSPRPARQLRATLNALRHHAFGLPALRVLPPP